MFIFTVSIDVQKVRTQRLNNLITVTLRKPG